MNFIPKQLIRLILVIFVIGLIKCDSNEICSTFSGRRVYLDENGSGSIQAANVTVSSLKNVRFFSFNLISLQLWKAGITF